MSAPAPVRVRLIRPCLGHAWQANATPFDAALAQADTCPDCLVTDPVTGKWVTCPSNAAPL